MAFSLSTLIKKLFPVALMAIAASVDASPLFSENSVVDVDLIGPMGSIVKNKKDRTELPFILVANGVKHHIRVRVRGKSRLRVCDFPPLRLNFAEGATEQTIFAGQDKLKLVTHCRIKDETPG